MLEFGFFRPVPEASVELLFLTAGMIGVAVRFANFRARIVELLEETQLQS